MRTHTQLEVNGQADGRATVLAHAIMIYVVALVPTLPTFLLVRPLLLEVGPISRWDPIMTQFVLFLVLLIAFITLVQRFQRVVFGVLVAALLSLTVTTISGTFGFGDLVGGYAGVMGMLRETSNDLPMAAGRFAPFHDAFHLRRLVEQAGPEVRKAAVRMATAHFTKVKVEPEDNTLVQSFSVFKEINGRWRYVSDRKGGEYFASPAESQELMAGDCDDHAVLMAACIKAIGGEVRLVRTNGHIYPELKVGDDARLARATELIRKELFVKEARNAPLHHHTDRNGMHWINLDYTRPYPGGELMDEGIIGILDL
ncbi:MAG: hypothetical protein IPI81_06780 [Flavobacteriales bacterium]|nr:hypothetical protein [Flavobacteriales bacterium]MCC6938700.1 hypothetical protein [Flavobacteriales bacterium]